MGVLLSKFIVRLSVALAYCLLLGEMQGQTSILVQPDAGPCTYHCFCKARCGSGDPGTNITDPIIDWGPIKTYHNHCLNKEQNADDCTAACSDMAINDTNWNNASFLCQSCPSGKITAYAAVATKEYKTAQTRVITNTPAVVVTTCTCPKGWLSNTTNQDGGVTTDGRCKKTWCMTTTGIPGPENGTQIGSWGFVWENSIWVYGTAENGGAPTCCTVAKTSAVCKILQ